MFALFCWSRARLFICFDEHSQVLPPLLEECKKPIMIPFVLPNIMAIAEGCSMVEFEELFFPHLEPVFALEDPVQIMSIFLLKFEVLLTRTPKSKLQVCGCRLFNTSPSLPAFFFLGGGLLGC